LPTLVIAEAHPRAGKQPAARSVVGWRIIQVRADESAMITVQVDILKD
jgi:hypothetical protein